MRIAIDAASPDPRLIVDAPGFSGAVAGMKRRLAQGELGSLPVVVGLGVI